MNNILAKIVWNLSLFVWIITFSAMATVFLVIGGSIGWSLFGLLILNILLTGFITEVISGT